MIIVRGMFLFFIAAVIAIALIWTAWSWVAMPAPAPDDSRSDPVHPIPAPPLPDVEPSFKSLAEPPVQRGSIRWEAVYTLARLAQIAYAEADEQEAQALEIGAFMVQPLAKNSSEGFVASDDQTVVISFRGTQGFRDIVTDTLGFPKYMQGGVLHHGFARAVGSIYQSAIDAAYKQGAHEKTVWITGHSLGGAIACGFSMEAAKKKSIRIDGIVTFGQPLVMSKSLCQYMIETFGDRYLRVVNGVDPITTLVNLYRHAGARAQLHNDGEYDWQPPIIATMAPPPGLPMPPQPEPEVLETNSDLQLISVEEARELDRRIKAAFDEPAPTGPMVPQTFGGFYSDPVAEHYMPGYLSRLREIARRKTTKPTVSY